MKKSTTLWEEEYKRKVPVEKYQEINNYWWIDCYNEIQEFILDNIKISKNDKILEAGCGSGNSSLRLARKVKEVNLLDKSSNSLKCARKLTEYYHLSNVNFCKGDIFHMPYPDQFFNFSWNIGVIEHYNLQESKKIIKEMIRVTKNDGYICIGVPNFLSLPILKARLLAYKPLKFLTSQIKGFRLKDEKEYNEQILKGLIEKVAKEESIKLNNVNIGYVGSVLFVETPKFIFKAINPLVSKIFSKNSFLILFIIKINRRT